MVETPLPSPELKEKVSWRSGPFLVLAFAAFIVLAGIGTLIYNDRSYDAWRRAETRSQAEVLAASLTAALDFGDRQAASETVSAFRVNRQVRWVGAFDRAGTMVAGYSRVGISLPQAVADLGNEGAGIRVIVPVEASGQLVGHIGLELDRESLTRKISRYFILAALIILAGLVMTMLGLGQARLRRANLQLEDRAEALAAANVLLAEQMEVRASAEEQLRQSQKMQALGQLTGGIAHDFNNLLTVIQGSADMLTREGLTDAKRVRFANAIVQASANAASLTSQLLAFARRQPLKPEHIDVNELIGSMRDLLDRTLGERIEVQTELAAHSCPVEVDRPQLQSAILNIASNARDAMQGEGKLTIATRSVIEAGQVMVALDLADTGAGIPPESLKQVFEPFFTTKGTGKGTGLGLSQVYGFATQSGGTVAVQSEVSKGTKFTISLPCAKSIAASSLPNTEAPIERRLLGRILLVEDNVEVGSFAKTMLIEHGHSVVLATSAEEALDLVTAQVFDLVFSDVVMPGMGGLRLAEILGEQRPDLPVLLATGYSEEIARNGAKGCEVVLKPYRLATLQAAIEGALMKKVVRAGA
jgi:signal transduction histidine kinase